MASPTSTPHSRADWYADPDDPATLRYWDGHQWTIYTLPKPDGWGAGAAAGSAWWQSWWAIVPGLLLCLPLGLIGLWRRPGLSLRLRVGVTAASLLLIGVVLSGESADPDPVAKDATSAPDSSAPTSTSSPSLEPTPSPTEPPRSVVPRLTGLTRDEAEERLIDAGLAVREVRQVFSPRPPGTVLSQSKKVGASLLAGSEVVLVVAKAYPQVPDVVGRTKAAAISRLRDAGFKVDVTIETRTLGKDGVVLRQTPGSAKRAKPNSSVTVVVSSVVRPVAPPPSNCTPGYDPCLAPASDYDCAGGSGDGPAYTGWVRVTGSDPYGLDADGDGVGCDT